MTRAADDARALPDAVLTGPDPVRLWRAAAHLALTAEDGRMAEEAGLIEFGPMICGVGQPRASSRRVNTRKG